MRRPPACTVLAKLAEVTSANETMGAFYAEKRAAFSG